MKTMLKKGQIIYIDNVKYIVSNMVKYAEDTWIWYEYAIVGEKGERIWLCIEEDENGNEEYSIYESYGGYINDNEMSININDIEYELYEKGKATVKDYFGDADVDMNETCNYTDYMSKDQMYIASVEYWEGEVERSIGQYIDSSAIRVTDEFDSTNLRPEVKINKNGIIATVLILVLCFFGPIISAISGLFVNKSIQKYLDKSSSYKYVTSVTNNTNNKKAKVYKSSYSTIDKTVKNIIDGVPEGITKTIDPEPGTDKDGIGLQTKKEFAYIYEEDGDVYVQVSKKDYVENNGGSTYHSGHRSYYHSAYRSSRSSSTYSSYASSARQSSINSRSSSGGGTSSGK
ncbi:MAG: DUF4178 domain-containing protein [Clostridia bacterium]|nr:DUF4178 domain-containing protein [Clostridia bacterium]